MTALITFNTCAIGEYPPNVFDSGLQDGNCEFSIEEFTEMLKESMLA